MTYFNRLCSCGQRLGQHRIGTDQCPNPQWRSVRGLEPWLPSTFEQVYRLAPNAFNGDSSGAPTSPGN